ncbi:MAG TPA: hypothetical protein VF131_16860 [Blastocatellia bacterium]|nr:hypothetical protein [Blastocatellia bacterium]
MKFCKSCGANLHAVRQAVTTRETGEKIEWSKSWGELKRRQMELEMYLSPEEKRYKEIKAGVITSCVGIAGMIFLYILMQGIILGGDIPPTAAEILSRVWVAGVIPFFVGIGILINGLVVSKKLVELANRGPQQKETARILKSAGKNKENATLSSADWHESDSPQPSVTENTTRQLRDSS